MDLTVLYSFITATFVLAMTPGPDNIYVLMQSVVHGKKYGLSTVAGLMTGCLIHTSLVAFGVSVFIAKYDWLFFGLKLFGALYLFYLAFTVWKGNGDILLKEGVEKQNVWQLFKQGFFMNILNPKVSIFFLAFFPGFLFSEDLSVIYQFYLLGFLFILVSFIVFGGVALFSSQVSGYIKQSKKVGVILKWVQIIVFVAIGVFILFSKK